MLIKSKCAECSCFSIGFRHKQLKHNTWKPGTNTVLHSVIGRTKQVIKRRSLISSDDGIHSEKVLILQFHLSYFTVLLSLRCCKIKNKNIKDFLFIMYLNSVLCSRFPCSSQFYKVKSVPVGFNCRSSILILHL